MAPVPAIEEQIVNLVATARRYNHRDPRYLEAHRRIDIALSAWESAKLEELVALDTHGA